MSTVRQPYHNANTFILQFHMEISGSVLAVVEKFKTLSGSPQSFVLKHAERYQYPTGNPSEPEKYTVKKERVAAQGSLLPRQEDMYYN